MYGGRAYRCVCNGGFVGNGITCANYTSGGIGTNDDLMVNMHLSLGPTITINRTEENFPIGKATTDFKTELKQLESAGTGGKEVFCDGD